MDSAHIFEDETGAKAVFEGVLDRVEIVAWSFIGSDAFLCLARRESNNKSENKLFL